MSRDSFIDNVIILSMFLYFYVGMRSLFQLQVGTVRFEPPKANILTSHSKVRKCPSKYTIISFTDELYSGLYNYFSY